MLDAGVQIETASFGWRRITTEHERSLEERREYEKFLEKFSSLDCPDSRWHSDCVEMFQNMFEDILYYGDD